ncbi:hypothetical protein DPMN_030898 [Dreissena polymorpha]|uniref:Uncharacterized protein n=1 Tax=Dreissena polymorpha TaxID=45954 RepID=A0A9D4RHI4_DREPO|nr:hypothetical protein DPMN_030898 [Dreissena polymorpha]
MDAELLLDFIGVVQTASGMRIIPSTETDGVHGKVVQFCTHKGIRLLPKSKFIDHDWCTRCECSDTGLRCHGMSSDLYESQCTNVKIACQNKWVLTADTTKILIPEYIQMFDTMPVNEEKLVIF